jgi:probable F420-dependent oxidoreductase
MSGVHIAISLTGIEHLTGDIGGVLDFARTADAAGADQLTVSEHVAMGSAIVGYPYGRYPSTVDADWYEPVALLSAVAAVTVQVRLSTSILIAPLRPAVLLAKQLATLDHLSRGRLEIGLGTGWQKAEYDGCGVAFEGRTSLLDEQVQAMRALWTSAPARFAGQHVAFDGLYSLPFPRQPSGVPIWFGIAPGPRNIARIADHGAGWAPWFGLPSGDTARDVPRALALERIAEGRERIHAALIERGRDPAHFSIRVMPEPVLGATGFDLAATIAAAGDYVAAGVTHLEFAPGLFCRDRAELADALAAILALRG